MIHAPFNFVPLTDKVFFPDWADQISHDIPFEDGTSGVLRLKITAQTPVFVRNGHTKQDADDKNETYTSFSKSPDNKYFIPGSSLKGSIRNVLEIISFGKLNPINNARYAVRDLSRRSGYMDKLNPNKVRCGWLSIRNDKMEVVDCGKPYFISHKELDSNFKTRFLSNFSSELTEDQKLAKYKYEIFAEKRIKREGLSFKLLPKDPNNKYDIREKVKFDANGEIIGTLVFTGQPGSSKKHEFVFSEKGQGTLLLDNDVLKDFQLVYEESADWEWWEKQLKNGLRVPIFFVKDEKGKIIHMGLSYLYKLIYPFSTKKCLSTEHTQDKPDMAECIFGHINGKNPLKGRVVFGHAFAENAICLSELNTYCVSPKANYYPIYIQQDGDMLASSTKTKYTTMFNSQARLKGWKRYPIRNSVNSNFGDIPDTQKDNTSPFIPLDKGTEFTTTIYYHNLKPEELGALLSAIELGENQYHSIGFAKAHGYGAIKVEIVDVDNEKRAFLDECKLTFVNLRMAQIGREVVNHSLNEFRKMSSNVHKLKSMFPLTYMTVEDYAQGKNDGEYLLLYSEMLEKENKQTMRPSVKTAKAKVMAISIRPMQASIIGDNAKYSLTGDEKALKKLKIGKEIDVDIIYSNSGKIKELKLKS